MMGLFSTHTVIYRKHQVYRLRALSLANKRKKVSQKQTNKLFSDFNAIRFNVCMLTYFSASKVSEKHAVITSNLIFPVEER